MRRRARNDEASGDEDETWSTDAMRASTSGTISFIELPISQIRRKFEPECRLVKPEADVFGTQLVECSDPVPERKSPKHSPVIPKKQLDLGLLKQQKCLDQVLPELFNMASSRCKLASDAHPNYQDSFIVLSQPDAYERVVIKTQDGLLSKLVRKEILDERVLYMTDESLSEVKTRLSKAEMLNKQEKPQEDEILTRDNLKSSKTEADVRIRELTPTERALCPAETIGKNVFELSTSMFRLPTKFIDPDARICPCDLDRADQSVEKYSVLVRWCTKPHLYKAEIKIAGNPEIVQKAIVILNNSAIVSKCRLHKESEGKYFSSNSWLGKGTKIEAWFKSRGGYQHEEDLMMSSEELEHVVRTMLEVNNITMIGIIFWRRHEENISQKDAEFLINQRMARCAIHSGVWEYQQRYTDAEWRNFFDRGTQRVPWKIADYKIHSNKSRDIEVTVEFSSLLVAAAICNYILQHCDDKEFLKFNRYQVLKTKFYCRYQTEFFVPPEIRFLLDDNIRKLDAVARKEPEFEGAHSTWARIRDLPNSMMCVEGWSRAHVDSVVQKLKANLKPAVFDCSLDNRNRLLFGCGLQLVNQQQERFAGKILISVDRLNENIVLIGNDALIAGIKQCFLEFVEKPHNFGVFSSIKIDPPMYLPTMKSVLDYNGAKALSGLLGGCFIEFQKPNLLLFEGSVHQYNQLKLLLDQTQYEVLNKVTEQAISKRAKEMFMTTSECPVCMNPYSFDKYRVACGHAYCLQCLTRLIKHCLRSGEIPVRCVLARCQKPIGIRDIMSLLFDEKAIYIRNFFPERLEPLFKATNRAAAKTDELIPCIKVGCEGFLERAATATIRTIYCPICRTARCAKCTNPPHRDMTCEQEAELRASDELSIEHYIKGRRDNIKKCPTKNCEALIQKDEGCNHMHCSFCKMHFCWTCLFSASSQQEVYAHMQKEHGGTGGEWGHLDNMPPIGFGVRGFRNDGPPGFGFHGAMFGQRGFGHFGPGRPPAPRFLGNLFDSDSD